MRPQLVSLLAVGAAAGVAEAELELETTAAFGKGAAVCACGAVSEPPPQAVRRAVRRTGRSESSPSHKSRALKGLLFLTGSKLRVTVECMNKLSVCPDMLDAECCNQTKARV